MKIKVVPRNEPNADGVWLSIPVVVAGRSWTEVCKILEAFVPEGHYLVSVDILGSETAKIKWS